MPDWTYTFDRISKATWLKQIEADLWPKEIVSIQSEWWPGEIMNPTLHEEDHPVLIRLPDVLFEQAPRIMEWINTSADDAKNVNQMILDALGYGAQSLVLNVETENKMPFRLWLDGVFTDMIEVNVSLDHESPEIIHAVREIIPKSALVRLNRNYIDQPSSVFFEALDGSMDENAKSYRFIYTIPSTGQWTKQTAEIFQLIKDDLQYWTSQGFNHMDYLENCILVLSSDTQYLKQLIQTRVLHIAWHNLWKHFTKKQECTSLYLECHVHPAKTGDPDHHLIRASSSALAASLTGVHTLCIHHADGKLIPSHYPRMDRNIHHLLNMESEMYRGQDPLSGSYLIDYYTHRWTSDIWNRLVV
ncbi:MAG TPA: methylmalonyl-CoA mutase family protein [Saprospiraceae bacterium]|nr:methylmalonyl-CoA mutase family protein [Saprospiraceae bacterium]